MQVANLFVAVSLLSVPAVGILSPSEIDKRVEAWQPTAKERAFERIGWAKDIREALKLARTHNRPVFLFTHDGRLGIGRC